MIVFDGISLAKNRELALRERVVNEVTRRDNKIAIAAILFVEDVGSQLYTRLKMEAAQRVGIEYKVYSFSFFDDVTMVLAQIAKLNSDDTITGIIIQKPWRKTWISSRYSGNTSGNMQEKNTAYNNWWHQLVAGLNPAKDVDGLHQKTRDSIQAGTRMKEGRVLPATVQAIFTILEQAQVQLHFSLLEKKVSIIGTSDIVGLPLYLEMQSRGVQSELLGRKDLQEKVAAGIALKDADIIISATGVEKLITGEMVKQGSIVIDVGEPKPDVDFASVSPKSAFITPVPGGVGPLTVVSLLENAVTLFTH